MHADDALEAAIAHATEAVTEELVTIRRDLHAHPEVGRAEHRTTARIVEILTGVGLEPRVLGLGTGAVCDVLPEGYHPDQGLVALRADIDALPIADGTDVAWASQNPGVAHACGHDVHTTVVLGVGLVLIRLREQGLLTCGVRLVFQPAEESTPGGALDVIADAGLEGVTEAYALHCDPRTDVGQVGLKTGPITSAADRVRVRLNGPGGHTSRPHLTADLIGALGALATMAPTVLSRRIDPRGGVSLIWGRVHAGSVANAIPQSGDIEGTLRALDVDAWHTAEALLPEILEQIVAPFGVEIDVDVATGVGPTVNDAACTQRLASAIERFVGPESVTATEQSLGGEDFSWMLLTVPGAMGRLGVRTPGAQHVADIHQPTFTVDEGCIAVGVRLLAGVAATSTRLHREPGA